MTAEQAAFFAKQFFEKRKLLLEYADSTFQHNGLAEQAVKQTFAIACRKIEEFYCSPNPGGWLLATLSTVLGNSCEVCRGEPQQAPCGFEGMSTKTLQEILRKHAAGQLSPEPYTQDLFKMMEVLSERRQQQPGQAFRSDEDAFTAHLPHCIPQNRQAQSQRKALKLSARLGKAVAAVLAVGMLLTAGMTLTAKALRLDIWGALATWTEDIFHFSSVSEPEVPRPSPATDDAVGYIGDIPIQFDNIYEALRAFGINEKILPPKIPDGYEQFECLAVQSPVDVSIGASYVNNDDWIIMSVRTLFPGVPMSHIEKNDEPVEVYTVNGIDYYTMFNSKTSIIAWVTDGCECIISCRYNREEMKAFIDTIHK